jgi:hypothetical protein
MVPEVHDVLKGKRHQDYFAAAGSFLIAVKSTLAGIHSDDEHELR